MPAVTPVPFASGAVPSQSFSSPSGATFGDRLQPASSSGLAAYNNDIASMQEQNRQLFQATRGQLNGGGAGLNGAYSADLAEMSRQSSQMLGVQLAMMRENLMFTSISNILKTKHDTLKNIISNIR